MSATPNFDRVARIYRWAEYLMLGPLLQKTRTHFLPRLAASRQAFILGDGDGRFTATLLASNASIHVHAVDSSATMLALLERRCAAHAARLTIEHRNALHAKMPSNTDLVVTHFFLDCLTQQEVDQLASSISQRCDHGTLWLISDFAIPPNALALPARLYIRSLYLVFRILTNLHVQRLPNTHSSLARAGFICIERYTLLGGLLYTELWRRE